jgi:D-alanine transaminase
VEAGANEAWLVDENGFVTEGAACDAWIVTADDDIITRQAESGILRGITRTVLIEGLRAEGLKFVERPFTVAEAQAAREAFNSSAVSLIVPVISIDDRPRRRRASWASGETATAAVARLDGNVMPPVAVKRTTISSV